MVEITIPLEELNGTGEAEKDFAPIMPTVIEEDTLPRIDVIRGVFITSRGEEIELSDKPISSLIVERLQNEGKPKIPMVEVTLLGKHKQMEPHVGHEGYQARLVEWQSESQMAVLRYLFILGTKGTPPPEFVEEQRTFFPGATDLEMKYLWVASRLPDEDMELFTEAVMGRSLPTAQGLQEAANSFRG